MRAVGQLGPIDGLDRVDLRGGEVEVASIAASTDQTRDRDTELRAQRVVARQQLRRHTGPQPGAPLVELGQLLVDLADRGRPAPTPPPRARR